jgi:3'(2'), 5'-bisphosphate nucleotidase
MSSINIDKIIQIAREAGKAILEIYHTDFTIENKSDHSPLTEADKVAHEIIDEGLRRLYPEIPILSEEGKDILYEERSKWEQFWLVDPLDGTKEFIKKNGEFTVNIALIENNQPVLGVVYLPVTDEIFYSTKEKGAFKRNKDQLIELKVSEISKGELLILVESRSHPSEDLVILKDKLQKDYELSSLQRGSSLKICAVAEGIADLYPRLGPTMEWDTAAGQAVVEGAGGIVVDLNGNSLQYNKESLKNDSFIVLPKSFQSKLGEYLETRETTEIEECKEG